MRVDSIFIVSKLSCCGCTMNVPLQAHKLYPRLGILVYICTGALQDRQRATWRQ